MALPSGWRQALSKVVGVGLRNVSGDDSGIPLDIGTFTSMVHGLLIQNIQASVIPEGAKQAIINAVSAPQILSETTGIIHIDRAMRPSVYTQGNGGKKKDGSPYVSTYGLADLVMIYNKRKAPGAKYYPVGVNANGKVKWAKMTGQMTIAINNNFIERTVAEGNALTPYGIVSLV